MAAVTTAQAAQAGIIAPGKQADIIAILKPNQGAAAASKAGGDQQDILAVRKAGGDQHE